MSDHTNIVRIKAVAKALGDLKEKVVFVGGATLSLYSTRKVFEVRPTEDVDIIVEVLNYSKGAELDDKLRSIGFVNDTESGIICRWRIQKIIVDIMPTTDAATGFSNRWYPEGFEHAINHEIDKSCTVRILDAPYFLATKIEAFNSRGNNDGRTSHDFEDIVYVLENRKEIWEEIATAPGSIKKYLRSEFRILLNNRNIMEWIDSHVERASPPATEYIYERLKEFSESKP